MRRVADALCVLALLGCGDPERSAGGSSYETENAVAARFLRPDGSPAAGVAVRARPLDWLAGDPAGAVLALGTDSSGRMETVLPDGDWRLEARLAGNLALLDVRSRDARRDFGDLRLSAPSALFGRAVPGTRVGISGLALEAVVDSGGYFRIDSLPAGVHVVREVGGRGRAYVETLPGTTVDAGTLRTDSAGRVLLDDFEDGDARIRTAPWTGGGRWRFAADSGILLSPDSVAELPRRAIVADGEGGKVLHVSAAFPNLVDSTSRAGCGVDFGTEPLDLSALASVRFRARGIGDLTVRVAVGSAPPGAFLEADVTLDSLWTEFEIPASSLRGPSGTESVLDSAGRTGDLRRALGLSWVMRSSGDLWLDDIRLVGPSSAVLWGTDPPP